MHIRTIKNLINHPQNHLIMTIKENDFVEIDYIGRLKDGKVFDTTIESVAKEHHLHNQETKYKPTTICVGQHQIVPGIDQGLIGKEVGKTYTVTLQPENAFGKKDAKQIRLVPLKQFTKQDIMPQPGLQVNIDNQIATILRVSGGRVLVDFNHPLASKVVSYELTIKKQITDPKEQIESFLSVSFPLPATVAVKEGNATITFDQELPKELLEPLSKKLTEITLAKKVEFKTKSAEPPSDKKEEPHISKEKSPPK
jgi:FKBP-type peptidyl-prolyl cis-trans isomerase 2